MVSTNSVRLIVGLLSQVPRVFRLQQPYLVPLTMLYDPPHCPHFRRLENRWTGRPARSERIACERSAVTTRRTHLWRSLTAFHRSCEPHTGVGCDRAIGKIGIDVPLSEPFGGLTGKLLKPTVCGHGESCFFPLYI